MTHSKRLTGNPWHFFSEHYFFRNFLLLFSCMLLLFASFSVYIYHNSRQIILSEFQNTEQNQVETLKNSVDDFIKDARYIMALLDTGNLSKLYFHSENPELFLNGIYSRLQEQIKTYCSRQHFIDSVYLYSGVSKHVLTSTEHVPAAYFSDLNWLEHLTDKPEPYLLFPRCKNGIFPYLLCLIKQVPDKSGDSAIVINLNLSKLPQLQPTSQDKRFLYLVTDEGEILYRDGQQELLEPLSFVSNLSYFNTEAEKYFTFFKEDKKNFSYAQIHSAEYPWSYVIVSELSTYDQRLSDARAVTFSMFFLILLLAVIFSLLFTFRAAKPIRSLILMLRSSNATQAELLNDRDIKYIVDQITTYMQTNRQLSDELNARISLLNQTRMMALQMQINPHFLFNSLNMIYLMEAEALGYKHSIPKITLSLSRLLHYAIESTDLVPLETELNFTRDYLDILNLRYGGQLTVSLSVQEDGMDTLVPKLFIQPLVENSVYHGLAKQLSDDSHIWISFACTDGQCCLSVRDNGQGMPKQTLAVLKEAVTDYDPNPREHIGIHNVALRMHMIFGDAFHITIESEEGTGTTFSLYFPYRI